ncbi:putative transcription factor/ chromatin remodeling BED-type(Zn) family [Arabidopsis thaliana]
MATTTNATTTATQQQTQSPTQQPSAEELATKALQKRYEGLMMVRTKAVKGKGAWYWSHLEPILLHNTDTGFPKAVKLRCSLCDAVFSASNPSRTASEHLKRGTCPNFNSLPKPISIISPSPPPPPSSSHRKRNSSAVEALNHHHHHPHHHHQGSYNVTPLSVVDPSRFCGQFPVTQQPHLMLSGGKDDLGPLAMLEDSVKKLKSPKTSQTRNLTKAQIDSALDSLSDWVFESCGSVSLSGLEHPKLRAFLTQVGLPIISRRDFVTGRLDLKYEDSRAEAESRIHDAMFFQIASDGWKFDSSGENLVNLIVNLPNGTSLYRRAVFVNGAVPSNYAEEVLWETVRGICGNSPQRCVGIVSDRFMSKALRNLESQHQWMVNLSCQFQGFNSLIRDFVKELPLFKSVSQSCSRLVNFVSSTAQIRNAVCKYQLQEQGETRMLHLPLDSSLFEPLYNLLEDVLSFARAIQLVMHDDVCKAVLMEDHMAREVGEMVGDVGFWNEVEAVYSLLKLVKEMARRIEEERPLVGQCLPLWDELRSKIKDWYAKFNVVEERQVEKIVERRFKKSYHPAWAAAFILDPLYLIKDSSGKYLPPFKCLSPEQEKDVDKLITRLVSRDEAHIAMMELMKWRTEGLDPVYARAVQMKERDPVSGKMRIANPQSSRLVWETYLSEFRSLGRVAVRLIFLHATSCGFKCNSSVLRWVNSNGRSRAAVDRAQKLIFISANSKFERRDFSNEEERDAELLAMANGEDDVLNDVLIDTSSV